MTLREPAPRVSVIILSWNGRAFLEPCVNAVLDQGYPNLQLIVVDNGSSDGSADLVADRFPQVQVIRNKRNLGFAGGNNVGLLAATGDVLVLLNQDTVVHDGWLAALVSALDDPSVGFVGCKLLYPDGTIQHAGALVYGARGETEHIGRHQRDTGQYDQPCEMDFVTGAAIGLRRETLVQVGPLDEGFFPAYFEDVDWCYRARAAGLRSMYWPSARVSHWESISIQPDSYAHKAVYHHGRVRLLFKHKPLTWLATEFAPAESDWVKQLGRTVEMMAVRDAYQRIILTLPDILEFRLVTDGVALGQDPLGEWNGLLDLTTQLRAACVQDEPAFELRTRFVGSQVEAGASTLLGLWRDLQSKWNIEERPFRSNVPVAGKAIAAFRKAWNDVATRWYVLPILQQQIDFNSATVNVINTLMPVVQELAERIDEQQRDIAQNERELDRLARAMSNLERSTDNCDEARRVPPAG